VQTKNNFAFVFRLFTHLSSYNWLQQKRDIGTSEKYFGDLL
jgi:hypothetical protein